MKTIELMRYGGPEALAFIDRPVPRPEAGQVLVRIHAASLNPIDLKKASGAMRQIFPLEFPFVPGVDFSGVVEAVGPGVNAWQSGDAVFGHAHRGGAYAEWIVIDSEHIAAKPERINHVEAASLAVVGQTAAQALDAAGLEAGHSILIHGASGAVGGAAVQLAHRRGANVLAMGSAISLERLRSYGIERVFDYKATRFEEVASGVDAVLDTVGGEVQQRSFGVLRKGGVLVSIAQPPSPEEAERLAIRASMLFTKSSPASLSSLAASIDEGFVQPHVGRIYPLDEAAQAWRDFMEDHIDGKVVFAVSDSHSK